LQTGGLAVAGIAILSAGHLFPVVLRFAGMSSQDGILSIAMVAAASLILGVAVWLLIYVPASILADRIASATASRMALSALFSTVVLAGITIGVLRPLGWKLLYFLLVSVVLGLGGAVYSFFRAGIARQLSMRSAHASGA
jgi:hypothetical protein